MEIDLVLIGWIVFGVFAAVTCIQILYYILLFSRLAFHQSKAQQTTIKDPVSVVICARDEAGNLARNLPGVLVQDYTTHHEIIVVNDNSQDETKYLLDEFKKSFNSLKVVELSHEAKLIPGKKYPLSMGIISAKNETLVLTDADCVPASEYWVQKMQSAYKNGTEIVLGYGAYRKRPGLLNKLIRFETFHTALQYLSYALAGIPYMGVGRNLSYKKSLFMKNKGFSSINHVPSGDDDLFIKQVAKSGNTAIMIDKEAHTLSEPKKTWNDWMRQKYRHYTTGKFYRPIHKFLLGTYAATLVLFWPLFVAAVLLHTWWFAVSTMGLRLLIQAVILFKCMKKLNEKDLWPFFLFYDIWMCIYYLLVLPSLWKAPQKNSW